jgi:hypothetical protein
MIILANSLRDTLVIFISSFFLSIALAIVILAVFELLAKLRVIASFSRSAVIGGRIASVPFGFAAVYIGYITGLSRDPAVGALVPAVLSLLTAASAYLAGKDRAMLLPIGMAVAVFFLNINFGASVGSQVREQPPNVESLLQSAEQEARVKKYRMNLGLE